MLADCKQDNEIESINLFIETDLKIQLKYFSISVSDDQKTLSSDNLTQDALFNYSNEFQKETLALWKLLVRRIINRYDTIGVNSGERLTINDLIFLPGKLAYLPDSIRQQSIRQILEKHKKESNRVGEISDLTFFKTLYPDYFLEGDYNFPSWATKNISKVGDWNVLRIFRNTFFWKYRESGEFAYTTIYNANTQAKVEVIQPVVNTNRYLSDPLTDYTFNAIIQAYFKIYMVEINKEIDVYYLKNGKDILGFLESKLENRENSFGSIHQASMPYLADECTMSQKLIVKDTQHVNLEVVGQMVKDNTQSKKIYGRDYLEIVLWDEVAQARKKSFRYYYAADEAIQFLDGDIESPFFFKNNATKGYLFEAKIPWIKFSLTGSTTHDKYFNLIVADSDHDPLQIESKLEWLKNDDDVPNLRLTKEKNSKPFNGIEANYIHNNIVIDGIEENEWSLCDEKYMENITSGQIESLNDNSASVKLLWDDNYLYVFVKVNDQVKQAPYYITSDYAQVVNEENNELIWQSVGNYTAHFPEYYDSTTLCLHPGIYLLNYISDKQYSMEEHVPAHTFYGVILKNVKQ